MLALEKKIGNLDRGLKKLAESNGPASARSNCADVVSASARLGPDTDSILEKIQLQITEHSRTMSATNAWATRISDDIVSLYSALSKVHRLETQAMESERRHEESGLLADRMVQISNDLDVLPEWVSGVHRETKALRLLLVGRFAELE